MRDLALLAIVLGSIPYMFKQPFYGLLMWVWFSLMNPHRLAFGFAYGFPFAMTIALITFASLLFKIKKNYPFPVNGVTVSMLTFVLWLNVSPLFSFHPEGEMGPWLTAIKIQIMVLITFFIVGNRRELHLLTWVMALSIGFFGIKGGIFTLVRGGTDRVWGPSGSFIEENNALGLAIIMTVPIFRYLQLHSANKWVRHGCTLAMLLCVASAVGSQSRGALLALVAMTAFLWVKSPNKGVMSVLTVILAITIFATMPDSWHTRMQSIGTYSQDESAMGRINAWWMTWNLAVSRIPIGGGFNIYTPELFGRFAPNPTDLHAAHSIYFQVLGEHGFIGLFLFLAVFISAWRCGSWVIAATKKLPELRWAHDLAAMMQVSLVGYLVGGMFLSLTYYDFPYYVASILVITRIVVKKEIEAMSGSRLKTKTNMSGAPTNSLGFRN